MRFACAADMLLYLILFFSYITSYLAGLIVYHALCSLWIYRGKGDAKLLYIMHTFDITNTSWEMVGKYVSRYILIVIY